MLPCAPAGTLRQLVARLANKLGREIEVAQMPRWTLRAIAIFMPPMRELDEMLYQWDEPFVIDARRFRERFHLLPEDGDQAAADTVGWATQHYGARAGAVQHE